MKDQAAAAQEHGLSDGSASTRGPAFWLSWLQDGLSSDRLATWVVLILGALIFLPRLGSMGLWDPWETHYGEVAREMIVRDDYVYPHWESAYFFSKPPLAMWLMAAGMLLVGAEGQPIGQDLGAWAEWGVRLPFALIGIASLWAVYSVGRQLRDRTTGVLAAMVLAGSVQFIAIGKQSMVDMPLVGCLTVGLALFCLAVFDPSINANPREKAPIAGRIAAALGIVVGIVPQYVLHLREFEQTLAIAGLGAALAVSLGLAVFLALFGNRRACYLSGFYVLAGYAALAKGPAALYVLGPVVLLYIFFTWDWHLLWRCWLLPGGLLFLLVAVPWFLALSLFDGRDDEGRTFVGRFWIHDTFNRLGRGVHGDRPTMGYYIEQLAYGMWPWSALAPFALGLAARVRAPQLEDSERGSGHDRRRLLTFVLMWAVWSYVGFSMSKTGFHHYVFPAVPPLAVLIAYWLRWVADEPEERLSSFVAIPVLAVFAVTARDLVNDPQHLSSLFTYKYDRAYPRDLRRTATAFLTVFLAVGGTVLLAPQFLKTVLRDVRRVAASVWGWVTSEDRSESRWKGLFSGLESVSGTLRFRGVGTSRWLDRHGRATSMLGFILTGVVFATWFSHRHFNYLAQHWSQSHMFETYFKEKKGDEPIYAFQLNWRGETYYSRNTVIQVKEDGANARMRAVIDRPGREFVILEQSRFPTFKSVISPDRREKIQILDKSSIKFYLLAID